jgi:hypothetical protein
MTRSRFLVVAMPSPLVKKACKDALDAAGLNAVLQGTLFDPSNWHQSLSDRFFQRSRVESLRRACSRVRATACTLALNRVRGSGGPEAFHWAFHARGKPALFTALLAEVNRGLMAEGLPASGGHSPHISISYWAPCALPSLSIRPILWTIDEILLVEGHSLGEHEEHYRYDVIDRWPLQPPPPAPQRDLFVDTPPG